MMEGHLGHIGLFMFMYSDGGSFRAYRVFIKNLQDCTSHGIDI